MVNNKRYIGQTTYEEPARRWSAHKSDLKKQKHCNKHLQRAWNKYNESMFEFNIVGIANTIEELNKIEAEYVNKIDHSKLYNIRLGGNGGGPLSGKTKQKLSKWRKQFYNTADGKLAKQHLSEFAKNQLRTKESNLQRSQTLKRYEWIGNILIDPMGNEHTVDTVKGFCKLHDIKHDAHLRRVLQGRSKQYKGWRLK